MSYILDALRRAQGERAQAPPPAPAAAAVETPLVLQRLRSLPLPAQAALAGAGAAVLVLLLAWMLWPAQEQENPPAEAAIPTPPAALASVAPVLPGAPGRPTVVSMDDLTESDYGTPPALAAELIAPDSEIFGGDVGPEPQPVPEVRVEESPPPETSVRTVELEPPPSPRAVTPLREMSEDYRAAFPPFKIEVHAHDPNPALRFVLIEGRRYREGETLAQGPQLNEITADGLVFSFRDSEVWVPAGP